MARWDLMLGVVCDLANIKIGPEGIEVTKKAKDPRLIALKLLICWETGEVLPST